VGKDVQAIQLRRGEKIFHTCECSRRDEIHREPRKAWPETFISGRIPRISGKNKIAVHEKYLWG
jgi:hypothetical protein